MDSAVPSECCVCGVPIGVKGGVGGTLQSTSGLWLCFRRKCWKQHESVFFPDNERLMAIVNRRRDAESDARMAAHLYADALEHATVADAERDAATARAERAERERDDLRERLVNEREQARGDRVVASLAAHDRADKAEALLREARGGIAVHYGPNECGRLLARIDALLRDDNPATDPSATSTKNLVARTAGEAAPTIQKEP